MVGFLLEVRKCERIAAAPPTCLSSEWRPHRRPFHMVVRVGNPGFLAGDEKGRQEGPNRPSCVRVQLLQCLLYLLSGFRFPLHENLIFCL